MKTYAQIVGEIEALQKEAEALKQAEIEGVIARIKEAIEVYGLTPADLGFGPKAKRGRPAKAVAPKADASVKYRDASGNSWVGRGPRPKWVKDAIAAGKKLEDLAA